MNGNWLEERKKYIGASQIYGLVQHYFPEEVATLGFDDVPFQSAFALYHQIINGVTIPIDYKLSEYGLAVERLFGAFKRIEWTKYHYPNKTNPRVHKYASCNPDFLLGEDDIFSHTLIEFKAPITPSNKDKGQYVFQLQYQMLITNIESGILFYAHIKNNNEFERGKLVGSFWYYYNQWSGNGILREYVDDNFYCKESPYEANPIIQKLCIDALNLFEQDVLAGNEPEPRASDIDLLKVIYPEHNGTLRVDSPVLQLKIEEYVGASEVIAEHCKTKEHLKAGLRSVMGSNRNLQCGEWELYYDKGDAFRYKKLKGEE